jgi:hypothetical protein
MWNSRRVRASGDDMDFRKSAGRVIHTVIFSRGECFIIKTLYLHMSNAIPYAPG